MRPLGAQRPVDRGGHLLGGMKIRVVQHNIDHMHLLQIKGNPPLDQRSAGNLRRGRMV